MNNIDYYIYHHLGLGDHIICNGLIRYLTNKLNTNKIALIVKNSNFANVKRMFVDKTNITYFLVNNDNEFMDFYNKHKNAPLIKVGFDKCENHKFDVSFYESVNVPFLERWNSWYIYRDLEQQNKIFQELDINEDYIFVHDESSTGKYNLRIDSNLRQIRPTRLKCEKSIFDWIGVIESAKEVHVINSSFAHLVNSLNLKSSLIYHNIKSDDGMSFVLKGKNWNIISY